MIPSSILIVDTEADGVGPTAHAIEVACILYDVCHAAPVMSFASLLHAHDNAAEHVNRIPAALLPSVEWPAWEMVHDMAERADAVVAHNADFDRRFVGEKITGALPWICTMDDIAWPLASESRSLVALALAHGIGVASAHRALTDCDLISRLFSRVHEMGLDVGTMLERGLRPKALYQALVPYERNEEAKAYGFRWNRDDAPRMWARKMARDDVGTLPFRVREIRAT